MTVFARDGLHAGGTVVALFADAEDVSSVGVTAARIARMERRPVLAIVVARDADAARRTRQRALQVLDSDPLPRITLVTEPTVSTLHRAVGTRDSGTLVMATRGEATEAELVRELLATTSWNLILTRGSAAKDTS